MPRSDTTASAQAHYDALWKQLSPSERFLKGMALIMLSRQLLIAGIRNRFPHVDRGKFRDLVRAHCYP